AVLACARRSRQGVLLLAEPPRAQPGALRRRRARVGRGRAVADRQAPSPADLAVRLHVARRVAAPRELLLRADAAGGCLPVAAARPEVHGPVEPARARAPALAAPRRRRA